MSKWHKFYLLCGMKESTIHTNSLWHRCPYSTITCQVINQI